VGTGWVAPVVTGVVGVTGVAGTYLSARSARITAAQQVDKQRDHAVKERSRTERREAYVTFLEAVNSASQTNVRIQRMQRAGESGRAELRSTVLAELALRRGSLRLVASREVRRAALNVHQHLRQALGASVRDGTGKIEVRYEAALVALMKQDLDYELAPEDVTAMEWRPEDSTVVASEPDDAPAQSAEAESDSE